MTDEELEAELAKLTPEEREQLLADLESKEGGALAGQASRAKYVSKVSPKVARVVARASKSKIQAILEKRLIKCTDSDGYDLFVKGTTEGRLNLTINTVAPFGTYTDFCIDPNSPFVNNPSPIDNCNNGTVEYENISVISQVVRAMVFLLTV